MTRIILAAVFCIVLGASAHADGKAFPPDNCTALSPFMSFNGTTVGGNTYCSDGQGVLNNALPTCVDGQIIVFRKNPNATPPGHFYCEDTILAQGSSFKSNPSAETTWDFSIGTPGLLYVTADVIAASDSPISTAAVIYVDGQECGGDSYTSDLGGHNADADAACILKITPGTHNIEVLQQLEGSGARTGHQILWYVTNASSGGNIIQPNYH